MSFTEVTHESWFSRIGSSLKGILFGGILAVVAIPLLFWNEGRAVHRARTLAEGRGIVLENVPIDSVEPSNESKLVHLTGTAESDETLTDEKFAITVDNSIKLARRVEMYQWKESKKTRSRKKTGGGRRRTTTYSYDKVWSESPIDSSRFNRSQNPSHHNPKMPFQTETYIADEVRFGAFKLSKDQINSLAAFQPVTIDNENTFAFVDSAQEGKLKLDGNRYYRGLDPQEPRVGDMRIWFESIGPTEISLIYQQSGDSFVPYKTKDGSIALLGSGKKTADELFTEAETANAMLLWGIRLGGFLLMSLGFSLVMKPLAVFSDVIPFLGGLVGFGIAIVAMMVAGGLSLITIAVAWLFYRPVLAIVLFVGAVVLFFLARRFMGKRATVIEVDQPVVLG